MKKYIIAAILAANAALLSAGYYLHENYVFFGLSAVHVSDVPSLQQYALMAYLQGLQACKNNL